GGDEGDLGAFGARLPAGDALEIAVGDQEAVMVAERGLEQHADRKRKLVELGEAFVLEGLEAEDHALAAVGQVESGARVVGVCAGHEAVPGWSWRGWPPDYSKRSRRLKGTPNCSAPKTFRV